MRERKYIKFRVDMFEDTKFKIIDRKPERDVIHYVWTRLVALAGKVNFEGDLYLSKNIPYTLETLAIEFNRNVNQIKLALDTFIELEMVEFIDNRIYRVKNFAKHQNIKVKEKNISNNKPNDTKVEEIQINEVQMNKNSKAEDTNNKVTLNKVKSITNPDIDNLETINNKIDTPNNSMLADNTINDNSNNANTHSLQSNTLIPLKTKTNKQTNKKNAKVNVSDIVFEENKDDYLVWCTDGEYVLDKDERVITSFSFD